MPVTELPFRQIHLDFHTSESIPDVGAGFDPDEFADTLQRAHVNSINIFARCHHGWLYYDSKRFPERIHPSLKRPHLLREQIDACHKRGIRTPIYITVQWDQYTSQRHPEWRVVGPDGTLTGTPPYEAGFYGTLCLNTPYVAWLQSLTQEVMDTLPVDGLWFDIVDERDCSCWACRQGMLAEGLDPSDRLQRMRYARQVVQRFQHDMTAFVRRTNKDCLIFYNSGHIGPRHRARLDTYTHLEVESLPGGAWGYLHFPLTARFVRNLGPDYLGMTGKFHTTWGDFHSFKNPAALEFECFQMLALNGKCSIGDQLHPSGRICADTYNLIAPVYAQVEQKEPWCRGARPVTEIGVLTVEEFAGPSAGRQDAPMRGVVRMLQEGRHQFDVLDSHSDFSAYKVLILPDQVPVSSELERKLDAYLVGGGALIASFASGMDAAQTRVTLGALGVTLTGEGERDAAGNLVRGREYGKNDYVDYILPRAALGHGLPQTEHVMYTRGMQIAAAAGSETLADIIAPYFDRTYQHFCSHNQTPSSHAISRPAVVQNGRCIYFCHPVFSQYQQKAPRWCKQLVLNALQRLLPEPLLRVSGPSGLVATVNTQQQHKRHVLHLLYYVPERRSDALDVIEDIVPLHDVGVSLRVDRPVTRVATAPQGEPLPFTVAGGRISFTVPVLTGHQMIEVVFA